MKIVHKLNTKGTIWNIDHFMERIRFILDWTIENRPTYLWKGLEWIKETDAVGFILEYET